MLSGCNIQLFQHATKLTFTQYAASELSYDTFYVKDQTRFAPVYPMEYSNYKQSKYLTKKLDRSRFVWFKDDEFMVPTHYKGEIIAYKSLKSNPIPQVCLERYEDVGYTVGIYGGYVGDDGYYHIDTSKNVIAKTSASNLFSRLKTSDIRIISINGNPIADFVDDGSGLIRGLRKDSEYTFVFYAGTQKYQDLIKADIHALQAYEIYLYNDTYVTDTNFGYASFNTPNTLKSGYYIINGAGLFKYLSYEKGSIEENLVDMNEKYYTSEGEMIRAYSQQYKVSLAKDVKDLVITMSYGEITDDTDVGVDIGCYGESPEGKGYNLVDDPREHTLTLSLTEAKAGDWTLSVAPKSLDILDIDVSYAEEFESTTLFEKEYEIEDGQNEFRMFYADILGDPEAKVIGAIINPDGVTYDMKLDTVTDQDKNVHRYLYLQVPYLQSGKYKMRIYYYQSRTSIENAQVTAYEP